MDRDPHVRPVSIVEATCPGGVRYPRHTIRFEDTPTHRLSMNRLYCAEDGKFVSDLEVINGDPVVTIEGLRIPVAEVLHD